jgi:hypothetical protein
MKKKLSLLFLAVVMLQANVAPLASAQNADDVRSIFQDSVFYDPNSGKCTETNTTSTSNSQSVYVIGDSLTVGMESNALGGLTLSKNLEEKGWKPTINAQGCRPLYNVTSPDGFPSKPPACPAGTITSAFNEFDKDQTTIAGAGAVVIALGTNNYERSEDLFKQKALEYIQKIRAVNSGIGNKIYWVNTYTKGGGKAERAASINQVVSESGIQLIDFRGAAINETLYSYAQGDSVHHDTNGYINKAKLIANSLGAPSSSSTTATTPGGYDPTSLSFPKFPDELAIAQGIEATIARRRPNSGWLAIPNLGTRIVEEGKKYNVNPLMVVASGSTESAFGTSSVGRTKFNSFGRTSSGTGYIDFGSFENDLFGERGFPRVLARNLYEGGVQGRYAAAKDIYEYFSIHQTGQIHYPGDGMYLEDRHTTPPTIISWDSPYNPLQYYKLNIGIINEVTGLNLSSDTPPHGAGAVVSSAEIGCETGSARIAGAGGFDLPEGGPNPMVYYSQLATGPDKAVEIYAGAGKYGTGTIEDCGCGPTSYAMAVSTLTSEKVTPQEMADWAYENKFQMNTCGSLWFWNNKPTSDRWGLQAASVTGTDQIAQSLVAGKLVIASVTSFPLPGSPVGHITLLRKYENGQFFFADSFADGWSAVKDVSRRGYSAAEVASMLNQAWALSPVTGGE